MRFKWILTIGLLVLAGCSTLPHEDFSKVQVGQEKGTVIDIMGSPTYKGRSQGQDFWNYRFQEANGKMATYQLRFRDGRVSSIEETDVAAEDPSHPDHQRKLEEIKANKIRKQIGEDVPIHRPKEEDFEPSEIFEPRKD